MNKWARAALFLVILGIAAWVLLALAACTPVIDEQPNWHEAPKPAPSATRSPWPVARMNDTCPSAGLKAKTASGNPMTCLLRPGEREPRWRLD